ncbi:glycoside hydrolase family 20 protein [Aplosporella prunicola CBS 121167]|uniref:beta-N-acetylhexosaminidase n=1 Tax=Aplosporella prunicola CBS 121167 TaxID=1176127 RepID=A0A6A6AYJ8_9PEZI|nr:glycoside hydrolase family 20 protein [Aplosporella prunicola CBS 121167]KAF2136686.1 glycoside hydrolase family 20 protein [Aplosporella prunicola CBS 121167]
MRPQERVATALVTPLAAECSRVVARDPGCASRDHAAIGKALFRNRVYVWTRCGIVRNGSGLGATERGPLYTCSGASFAFLDEASLCCGMAVMWLSCACLCVLFAAGSARLVTVPSTPFRETYGSLSLSSLRSITVDSHYANATNKEGETLIPPTLHQFARTFADDLGSSCGVNLSIVQSSKPANGSIFLTLDHETEFLDAAGRPTSEGYSISISTNGVVVAGASPLGAWWGTRTLIQAAVLQNNTLAAGTAIDAPGWGTRGIMLDAGRHYYPPGFLVEMCSYLSFFKQNTFHVHLSDNTGSVHLDDYGYEMGLYAALRLDSDAPAVAGLNRRRNESYTRAVFDDVQTQCARRGVTVVPEIEAPGHALVISQWKPELALASDYSMLNISHPETVPTVKAIWKTFLPWFHCKTVHIGADEYDDELVAQYNDFVNELSAFIASESGKHTRIWGTFPPSAKYTNNVHRNISIQHWAFTEDNPYHEYIARNYSVLNSDDAFYIVAKYSRSYPQTLNKTRIFHGDPSGGAFAPHIFDTKNASNNAPRAHPALLGHVAPLWNDFGPNATVYSEAYYAWRDLLPALADKQWGGDVAEAEYDGAFARLHAAVPAQNLDRAVTSRGRTILRYDFGGSDSDGVAEAADGGGSVVAVADTSGNGYDGVVHGCAVSGGAVRFDGSCNVATPLRSKGRGYRLAVSVRVDSVPAEDSAAVPGSSGGGALLSGADSALLLQPRARNGVGVAPVLVASGFGVGVEYALPVGEWVDLAVVGEAGRTFLDVREGGKEEGRVEKEVGEEGRVGVEEEVWAGEEEDGNVGVEEEKGEWKRYEFRVSMGIMGQEIVEGPVAIEAPVGRIGGEGFVGAVRGAVLLEGEGGEDGGY